MDLKAENVVLDSVTNLLFIVDFGSASPLCRRTNSEKKLLDFCVPTGTLRYSAPENWKRGFESEASDFWGLGVILKQLLCLISQHRGSDDFNFSMFDPLLQNLLKVDPEKRWKSVEVLHFLRNLRI